MNTIKSRIKIPANRIINIKIPDSIPIDEQVEVVVTYKHDTNSYQKKIEMLQGAEQDKNFLADIKNISEDFEPIDLESWE